MARFPAVNFFMMNNRGFAKQEYMVFVKGGQNETRSYGIWNVRLYFYCNERMMDFDAIVMSG